MFSAQLDPSPVELETEAQVVIRRSMVPSRSGWGIQFGDNNVTVDESTQVSEHDRLSTGGKRPTLGKGEPDIGVTDPDLERLLARAIITDEEYIYEIRSDTRSRVQKLGMRTGYAVSVEVHSSVTVRIRNATLISRKWSIVTGKDVDVALTE